MNYMASTPSLFGLLMIFLSMLRFQTGQAKFQTKNRFCSQPNISPGSKLSPISNPSWPSSPNGYFRFGFYQEDNGFAIGIWLVGTAQKTVVWTANRDDPPVDSDAKLVFTDRGELVILKSSETGNKNLPKAVITADTTTSSATSASLLDSGNLVLCNNNSKAIWQSFEHPTDTILQGQALPAGQQLLASTSDTNRSTGRFCLKMQMDGNLVLYPTNSEDLYVDAYWSSDTYSHRGLHTFHLSLKSTTGVLSVINSTASYEEITALNEGVKVNKSSAVIFRATVEYNGNFRLYSHTMSKNRSKVSMVWEALDEPCNVKGFCGLNTYCTLYDGKPNCFCIPGTEHRYDYSFGQMSLGCLRNYSRIGCRSGGKEDATLYEISTMENTRLEDIPYMEFEASDAEECRESCLQDCNCDAAVFEPNESKEDGSCRKQKLPLRYVRRDFENRVTAFIKVAKERNTSSLRNQTNYPMPVDIPFRKVVVTNKETLTRILVLVLSFVLFSCVALVISGFYIVKIRILRYKRLRDDGALGLNTDDHGIILRVFSYGDLRRATNGFREELGKGSFGAVYKGALNRDRKLVAVKRLEKLVEEGEREFRAEMRAIGRTNHKNLVRLLGYCAEGSKRLLVYEYMSNGSLADLLFKQASRIDWDERVRIATDVAKGILYLHEGCRAPIIHCDIKPQNILMDEFWTAKISDFGLAKFLMPDQTRTLTVIRGTRGYWAPEWHKNLPISVKADVYSYGIVLLEIVCCRRNLQVNTSRPEETVLANWAYKCFAERELNKLVDGEEVDKKTLEKMVKVGLWCIQDQPPLRPSMKSVVLMLEGITEVAVPPCPTSP